MNDCNKKQGGITSITIDGKTLDRNEKVKREHTINFSLNDENSKKEVKQYLEILEANCQWLIYKETGQPVYCFKCNCNIEHCKTYPNFKKTNK
jgi:hypothetical protein